MIYMDIEESFLLEVVKDRRRRSLPKLPNKNTSTCILMATFYGPGSMIYFLWFSDYYRLRKKCCLKGIKMC